jgi:hypothetical protein
MESVRGVSIVTTVVDHLDLEVGDMVREVYSNDDGMVWCRVSDRFAWIPRGHIYPLHVPVALKRSSSHAAMEAFLTKSADLSPDEGWASYLSGSGVVSTFKRPRSWQFGTTGWGERPGKTGGLHMCPNPDGSRRCQLSVEFGICGDSLTDTIPGSRAGVLIYLPNMRTDTHECDVQHETSMTLSFSALLLAYVETVSLVRKQVYRTPHHPHGGKLYPGIEWDFAHVPFNKPWRVSVDKTIHMREFARERASVWLRAERTASPDAWRCTIPRSLPLRRGDQVRLRLTSPGIAKWVDALVVDPKGPTFDVSLTPNTLCRTDTSMFFVS